MGSNSNTSEFDVLRLVYIQLTRKQVTWHKT